MIEWKPEMTLRQVEVEVILKALQRFDGNRSQAARALGVHYLTIKRRIECHVELSAYRGPRTYKSKRKSK